MTLIFEIIGVIGTVASVWSLAITLYDRYVSKKKSEPSGSDRSAH